MGFPAIAVITVSDFMMVAELRLSSQTLICSSTVLGLASTEISTRQRRRSRTKNSVKNFSDLSSLSRRGAERLAFF